MTVISSKLDMGHMMQEQKHTILSLIPLCQVFEELGHDPQKLLKQHGIDLNTLSGTTLIEQSHEFDIIQDAVEQVQDPLFGLKVGRRVSFSLFGTYTMVLLTARDFRSAVKISEQFQNLSLMSSRLSSCYEREHFELHYHLPDAPKSILAYIADKDMSGALTFLTTILGNSHHLPIGGGLARPKPKSSDLKHFKLLPKMEFEFDQPYSWLSFPNRFLHVPLKHANTLAHRVYLSQAQEQLRQTSPDNPNLTTQIRLQLQGYHRNYPSAFTVAKSIGMSERHLRRRLAEGGESYRQLVDEQRMNLASHLLRNDNLSVNQVAEELGYTEAASFLRAFKRWTGKTPKQFRQEN